MLSNPMIVALLGRATDFAPAHYGPYGAPLTSDPTKSFLSATLGSNMVLQQMPKQAVVWGFGSAGVAVTATFKGEQPVPTPSDLSALAAAAAAAAATVSRCC